MKDSISMDRSPVLFRCEGTRATGWEALYQCLTFAASLQRRRRTAYFIGNYEPFPLLSQVARGGNEYIAAEHPIGTPEDCDATIRAIRKSGAAAVVVAAPGVSTDYLRELSSAGALVAVIDSEASAHFSSKLVFNPLLGPDIKSYDWERGTQLCLGRRYAIVRPVFRRQRPIRPIDPQPPYRAIIAFGDDDFEGQSLLRAQELLAAARVDKVSVVVRSQHHQLQELKDLAEQHTGRMEVLTEPAELGTRLPRAHFVLTSGDGWSLEMACVGVPQFVLTQQPRHVPNAKLLEEEGAALYLGAAKQVSNGDLRDAIQNLLGDQLERVGMSRCARYLVDGRGPDRMVNALEVMLHPAVASSDERVAA
jgi:spore coat polysaccharide biosynthesis predicted glycosyltransferase SpsG